MLAISLLIILLGQTASVFGQEDMSDSSHACTHKITVSIMNMAGLDDKHLSAVKRAIFSQSSRVQGNEVYFIGWNGVLGSAGHGYSLEISDSPDADITILLTTISDPLYSGLTTVHYLSNHLASAHVVIYNADKISPVSLANLVRHEVGHALGLTHANVASSIMYPLVPSTPKYISDNDLVSFKTGDASSIYTTTACT